MGGAEHFGAAVIGPLGGNCRRRRFSVLSVVNIPASGGVLEAAVSNAADLNR